MQYVQLNSGGTVVASGSVGGGGSGIPSRSIIPLGTFWNNSYTANTVNNTYIATLNAANNGNGATGFIYTFERPAAIVGLNFVQAGPVTGTNTLYLLKNNSTYATLNMGTNNSGNVAPPMTWANNVYTFAAGDTLQCNLANSAAGNSQMSGYLTVEWLA